MFGTRKDVGHILDDADIIMGQIPDPRTGVLSNDPYKNPYPWFGRAFDVQGLDMQHRIAAVLTCAHTSQVDQTSSRFSEKSQ